MKKWLSILLTVLMAMQAVPAFATASISIADITYTRPGERAVCTELKALARKIRAADSYEEAAACVEAAAKLYHEVDDMYILAHVTDSGRERDRIDSIYSSVFVEYQDFIYEAMRTEYAQALREAFPVDLASYHWDLLPPTSEIKTLLERETRCAQRCADLLYDSTITYQKERYTLGELYYLDDDDYEEAAERWYDKYYDALLEAYAQLIGVRNDLAKARGYSNYADMCFDQMEVGYTAAMLSDFLADVLSEIVPVQDRLYYEEGGYYDADVSMRLRDFLPEAAELLEDLSPQFGECFREMVALGNYYWDQDYAQESHGVTYYMATYDLPVVAFTYDDDLYGMITVVHEFGHYYETVRMGNRSIINLDVAEIHSMAMELLFSRRIDQLDARKGYTLAYDTLAGTLDSLVNFSSSASIELALYCLPEEELTVENMKRIGESYWLAYGFASEDTPVEACDWIAYDSLFYQPFDGLWYSIAAVAALDIWEIALEDEAEAIARYEALIDAEPKNIIEATDALGVKSIFSPGRMERLAELLIDEFLEGDWRPTKGWVPKAS